MAEEIKTNTKTMYSDQTIWTFDGITWQGVCKTCKGALAKYTPAVRVEKGLKPCETCSTIPKED